MCTICCISHIQEHVIWVRIVFLYIFSVKKEGNESLSAMVELKYKSVIN